MTDHDAGHGESAGPPARDYDSAPLIVTWEATQACELSCDHCRAEAVPERSPAELATDEVKRLVEQAASFDPTPIFVVSGGDPLCRPDLFEILEYATDRVPTAVTPAPTPALDRAIVARFAALGVRRMALSVDRPTAATHDDFRGEDGSFAAARDAARWADEFGLSVQVNTTLTARTVESLPATASLVADLGADAWELFALVPVGRGAALDAPSPDQMEAALGWLADHAAEASHRVVVVEAPFYRRVVAERGGDPTGAGSVRAGNGFVFVDHEGEVYPSGFLPQSVGSIRETPLPELYREAPLMRALRDPAQFGGPCGRCRHREVCGGSRSRAWATTGDPLASDPLCRLVAEDRSVES